MNTIKWNLNRTGFVLSYSNGTKETYTDKFISNANYVKIGNQKFWMSKSN